LPGFPPSSRIVAQEHSVWDDVQGDAINENKIGPNSELLAGQSYEQCRKGGMGEAEKVYPQMTQINADSGRLIAMARENEHARCSSAPICVICG
jgi:hypothetical protein